MYIKLTGADPKGNTQLVLVNCDRVLGFQQRYRNDIGGNPITDKQGYPESYTEVMTRGISFYVKESVEEIQNLVEEEPIN